MFDFDKDPRRMLTAFFALFIFCGIMICFTARSDVRGIFRGIGRNRAFIVIMLAIILVQICMLYFGGATFRCTPLSAKELFFTVMLSLTVLPVDGMRRLFSALIVPRKKKTKSSPL